MTALVVLPVLDRDAAADCIATMHPEVIADLLIVDNTMGGVGDLPAGQGFYRPPAHRGPLQPRHNLGVSRAMNYAYDRLTVAAGSVLVWLSTSMRFGPDGGLRLLAAGHDAELGVVATAPIAWHAVALRPAAFDLAGRWDENFYPGYYEDTDWRRRLQLATRGLTLTQTDVGGEARDGHGYDVLRAANPGRQVVNFDALKGYYAAKWGGCPPDSDETLTMPWGDRPLDHWDPVTRDELVRRYGLGLP